MSLRKTIYVRPGETIKIKGVEHEKRKEKNICVNCSRIYSHRSGLSRHKQTCKPTFKCAFCDRCVEIDQILIRKCNVCDKLFYCECLLEEHRKMCVYEEDSEDSEDSEERSDADDMESNEESEPSGESLGDLLPHSMHSLDTEKRRIG